MTTLFESSNYLQQKLALEGLKQYRARLLSRENSLYAERARQSMGTLMLERAAPRRGRGNQEEVIASLEQRLGQEIHERLEQTGERVVEVIINQYNGHTQILLPVKSEDLKEGDTLADKLYNASEEVSSAYESEEFSFEGYMGFSLVGKLDKVELAQKLLAAAPQELGGKSSRFSPGARYFLRVAYNFCFNYVPGDNGKKDASPSNQVLTREEAVKYFEQGKSALELSQQFPLTKKMTLAGYMSAWRKGQYKI